MRLALSICVLSAMAGCSSGAYRDDVSPREKIIEIHHLTATGPEVIDRDSGQSSDLVAGGDDASAPLIKVRKSQKPKIVLSDPNPLLFVYSVGALTSVDTETARTASAVAGGLSTIAAQLSPKEAIESTPVAATCPKFEIQTVDVEDFFLKVSGVLTAGDRIREVIDLTTKSREDLAAAKEIVKQWKVSEWKGSVPGGLDIVNKVRSQQLRGEGIAMSVPSMQGKDKSCRGTLTRSQLVEAKVDGKYVAAFDAFVELRLEAKDILAKLEALDRLTARIGSVGVEQALDTKLQYSKSKRQTQAIVIAASTEFSPYLSDKAKAVQTRGSGTYKVSTTPFQSLHFQPSVGAIYSFVRAPKFTATSNGSGQFVISQQSNDYAELGAAIAGNIVWDEFLGQPVEPFVQLGVSPDDNLAFLAGVGVQVVDRFSLGAGIAYQRVKELSAGQAVGDVLASEGELKTESRYKSGLYLTFSYTLGE